MSVKCYKGQCSPGVCVMYLLSVRKSPHSRNASRVGMPRWKKGLEGRRRKTAGETNFSPQDFPRVLPDHLSFKNLTLGLQDFPVGIMAPVIWSANNPLKSPFTQLY